jgi:8-oxo-dGTP diphosphatase
MIKIKIGGRRPGAVVVILREDNHILILKRPDWIHWAPRKWALPGGKLEEGETPEQAAIRETLEETKLVVTNLKLVEAAVGEKLTTYYTRDYKGSVEIDDEHDAWAWASRDEIEKYDLAPNVLELFDWVLKNE